MGSNDESAGRVRSLGIGAAELKDGCLAGARIASSGLIDVWTQRAEE
jgi:hypothetical protein